MKCGGTMAAIDHSEVQKEYSKAYQRWTKKDDLELVGLCADGCSIVEMAERLGRPPTAVSRRIENLLLTVAKRQKEAAEKKNPLQACSGEIKKGMVAAINYAMSTFTGIELVEDEEAMEAALGAGFEVLGVEYE